MPIRNTPLVSEEIYHIYNRGVNRCPIFMDIRDYQRIMKTMAFYPFSGLTINLARFLSLSTKDKEIFLKKVMGKNKRLVEILCFCFMPNHFHLLLKQKEDGGISKFLSDFQNSFTKYFNTRHERVGPLFQGQFKSVRIETNEQLLHVSRYIHLNPYSSFVVKTSKDLEKYPWSSLIEYSSGQANLSQPKLVLEQFPSVSAYKDFILDQQDYQRELKKIEHLFLEH